MTRTLVAGEPIEIIREAFAQLKHRKRRDGMLELSGKFEPRVGEPLQRALLRIEKELLDRDVAQGDPDVRTTPERRADALVVLAERLTDAIDRS